MNTKTVKNFLKQLVPPLAQKKLAAMFYGWYGNYSSWEAACGKSDGYNKELILSKVLKATKEVMNGKAAYERDSYLFYDTSYNYQLLFALSYCNALLKRTINVIDFGGALGSLYWQHRNLIQPGIVQYWNLVEQPHFVDIGKKEVENDMLRFYYSVDDCLQVQAVDIIVLSSVLQYLPDPWGLLETVCNMDIPYIFIDRTAFIDNPNDRLTVQKAAASIYKATYPCWFLSLRKFHEQIGEKFSIISEFENTERANIRGSIFKGFFLKRNI
jgi:putative methyltransferase (TIGR04325 family)